ncbi:MAG: hypothetical protein PHQ86_07420 [Dehalococcoidales bacterium]|nr:hypothetical protein [Dehalococcoidales bacterium]
MKRFLFILGITVGSLILIAILVLGYFGFMPGVSAVFGSDKPVDLGVTYTEQDRQAGRVKAGWEVKALSADLPPEESLRYSGQNQIDTTFSEKELNAWINKEWKYFPISDCQIRINDDSTVEFSGKLHTNRLEDFAQAFGFSEAYSTITDYLDEWYIIGNPVIYIKFSGGVTNGAIVNAKVLKLKVGRLSIPNSIIDDNTEQFVKFASWQAGRIPGFSVEELEFINGTMKFVGTLPAIIERSPQ